MRKLAIAFGALALSLCFTAAQAATALLGFDDARHLLTRTGFGASPAEIESYAGLTREQAVDRLLASVRDGAGIPPPHWAIEPFQSLRRFRMASPEQRKVLQRERRQQGIELRAWWLDEMRRTQSPLTEKMTLFWHNHFVSSDQKVRSPQLIYRQNVLLRRNALGNFAVLLHEIARDPAMVIYLDNATNRKAQPNENFAREVMELFTVGEGHYSEQDIKEAARAFTGWSIDPDSGQFLFRAVQHDDDEKTVLGRTGKLDGDDVLDLLLAQPHTAEFITEKFWREFVSPTPDSKEVKRIAGLFRDSKYDIRVALRAILTSDAFYAPHNRATLIKSPVELVIGTLRQFGFSTGEMFPFAFVTARLGQNLFAPPNVKGWPGGDAWINSTTLLGRKQWLERMFADAAVSALPRPEAMKNLAAVENDRQRFQRAMADVHFDAGQWLAQLRSGDAAGVERVVLARSPSSALSYDAESVQMLRLLTQDPVYQLK